MLGHIRNNPMRGAALVELAVAVGVLVTSFLAFLEVNQIIQDGLVQIRIQNLFYAYGEPRVSAFDLSGKLRFEADEDVMSALHDMKDDILNNSGSDFSDYKLCLFGYQLVPYESDTSNQDPCGYGVRAISGFEGDCSNCNSSDFTSRVISLGNSSCNDSGYAFSAALLFRNSSNCDPNANFQSYVIKKMGDAVEANDFRF